MFIVISLPWTEIGDFSMNYGIIMIIGMEHNIKTKYIYTVQMNGMD